jgi:hypothetical protein
MATTRTASLPDLLTHLAAGPGLPPDTARPCARLLAIEKRIARHPEASCRKAASKRALNIRLRR